MTDTNHGYTDEEKPIFKQMTEAAAEEATKGTRAIQEWLDSTFINEAIQRQSDELYRLIYGAQTEPTKPFRPTKIETLPLKVVACYYCGKDALQADAARGRGDAAICVRCDPTIKFIDEDAE